MELRLVRHLWGVDLPAPQMLDDWEAEGYRALEIPEFLLDTGMAAAAKERGWQVIVQVFSDEWNYSHNVDTHVCSFTEQVQKAVHFGADRINCHGGEDAFTEQQAIDFFGASIDVAKAIGLPVFFETHRGRAMFTPWRTLAFCRTLPELRLCADWSHWTCVCERLIEDQDELLNELLPRVDHIHARVGHSQGPQVADPSDPHCQTELDWFSGWWKRMWNAQRARGLSESSVCPEFGPEPYLPHLPHTHMPVADLAQVCDWTAGYLRHAFDARS